MTDAWVRCTVSQGLSIEFSDTPPSRFIRCPVPRSSQLQNLMSAEVEHLLNIKAIESVPRDQLGTGFYLILFLVPKNSGGYRGILNLKHLNLALHYR